MDHDPSSGPRSAERGRINTSSKVNSACQRCRRHKSRCDLYRPCTLCVRADVECVSMSQSDSHAPSKRRRIQGPSDDQSRYQMPAANPQRTPLNNAVVAEHSITTGSSSPTQPILDGSMEIRTPQSTDGPSNVDYGEAESTMGLTRKIFQLGSQSIDNRVTSAIPDGDVSVSGTSSDQSRRPRRPVSSILGYALPERRVTEILLEEYFDSVHWFSLVIYEPVFRNHYERIADGFGCSTDKGFLVLLTTVLGIAAWYRSQRTFAAQIPVAEDWGEWSSKLLRHTESHIFEIMNEASLTSVQACILLGSYGVYHGKPNSSFALLGAVIKIGQALGLHREPSRGRFDDREERKRVWWTIYTWDRFASITYGRPLGINDKDCNVSMPSDIVENAAFDRQGRDASVCFSAYQRELNMLYLIASPMIETIFGIRTSGPSNVAAVNIHSALITRIHEQLGKWRQNLPPHLVFNFIEDCQLEQSSQSKAYRLQALALQLTYNNIVIVLHRPFLAQQVDCLSKPLTDCRQGSLPTPHTVDSSHYSLRSDLSSSELWWNAAVEISRVTELPYLAQLATDTHLVAFLAINLFNSAIVMVVCALSEPLSDRAQEAKRNITRIYRLQELLGRRSKLSMQSSVVLQDVIRLLLNREAEAMLASVVVSPAISHPGAHTSPTPSHAPHWSVEDTLRLPLSIPKDASCLLADIGHFQDQHAGKASRLNGSLVSVQKLFSGAGTEVFDHTRLEPSQLREQQLRNHIDLQDDMRTEDISSTAEDTLSSELYSENDLYWIWNSMTDCPL